MSDLVRIEIDGRIAIVRFDTGARANALSQKLMQDLTEAALQFHDAPEISTVILSGRDDQFSMGADLKDPAGTTAAKSSLRERRIHLRRGPRMCEAWENIDASARSKAGVSGVARRWRHPATCASQPKTLFFTFRKSSAA